MSSNLSTSARCYEATLDGKPVAFIGVLHQPGKITNMKRTTRLVVLPDYQGIGIGYSLQTYIARYYNKYGFVYHIITSARNLIMRLAKSGEWRLVVWGVSTPDRKRKTIRDRKMATFEYVGEGHVHSKQSSRLKMRNTRIKKK